MKTIKELLQLTLTEGNKSFKTGGYLPPQFAYYGLCGFVNALKKVSIINAKEFIILDSFIHNNRPQKSSPHYRKTQEYKAYYWKEGLWKPRRKWLIDQIKSL